MAVFQQSASPEVRPPAIEWPLLSISPDRHSIGVSALSFAQRALNINVDETFDMFHGSWDDETMTLKDSGLQPWLLLTMVCVNLFDGPWSDNGRYNESVRSMRALWKRSHPHEVPLFQELLGKMAAEMGELPDDSQLPEKVWAALQTDSALAKRGFKTNVNRFYWFFEVSEKEATQYFQKFFVFFHTSLEMDYLGG